MSRVDHAQLLDVSIHAPAGGATWNIRGFVGNDGFNPRARGGRDAPTPGTPDSTATFQSTRPRGARPLARASDLVFRSFNPRARGGRDDGTLEFLPIAQFQSTRPRGARRLWYYSLYFPLRFNPRARGGRDLYTSIALYATKVSIHAPAGGATQWNNLPVP